MPLDIAFGTAKLDYEDVRVPGKVPLVWDRRYSTALLAKPVTALGHGWTCRYFATLSYVEGRFEFVTPEGGTEIFPDASGMVAKGRVVKNLSAFLEIFRESNRCIVRSWNVDSGDIWRYCFEPDAGNQPWKLSSIEDVSGQGNDVIWDASGRLQAVRQRLERRELRVAYNKSGYIEGIFLDASGARHSIMTYAYDEAGRHIEARDAAKFADRFEYDVQGRVKREIVRDGGVFHYRYDHKGRCVVRTGLGHYNEKRLRFIDAIRVTEVTDSYDRKFTYHHLPSGQAVLEIDALGAKRSTEYDQHGRIVAKTDATGATTRYSFDDQGNRSSIIDALGNATTLTFNTHHQALTMTDAAGHEWKRGFDANNRLIGTMDPLGNRWLFRYDEEGNVAEVVNPKGDRKRLLYKSGILHSITDWLGNATQFAFDAFGRVMERRGALGEITRFRYDAVGNPVQVDLPDGATLGAGYDHAGNLIRFVDASGHITRWRFGPCMRLLDRTNPLGAIVRYVWGSERGRLEEIVNENGESYVFHRDDGGRVIAEVSFDGAERRFKYDAEGHSIAYTNANGETIAIERDPLHRVVGQLLPDGAQVRYSYDANGNLTSAINGDGAVLFERDALGRIVRETQGEAWVESHYDPIGNVVRTATSVGEVIDYKVDANGFVGRLTASSKMSIEFERNSYGQETGRRMPGGMRMDQRYDRAGRLIEQRVTAAAGLTNARDRVTSPERDIVRRSFAYGVNGALASIVDERWGRVEYTYDPAERLLSALFERSASEQFEYDPGGNVTRLRAVGDVSKDEKLVYGPGGRLLQKGATYYEYDAEGRRTRKTENVDGGSTRSWRYEWDALDRLRVVTLPDGSTRRYGYDALARRTRREGPGDVHEFIWNTDVIAHEIVGEGPPISWIFDKYTFAPIATIQNSRLHSVVNDHLGSPKELVDDSSKVVWSRSGDVWGKDHTDRTLSSGVSCDIRFQGHWNDVEEGHDYNRFRYYDPESGVFLSSDPIGPLATTNLYRVSGAPTKFIDPLGLCDTTDLPANSLTKEEAAEIQAIADRFGTQVDVIGSRAAGQGRDIDRPDLPAGKGPGTRSDIDVRIDGQVDIDTRGGLSDAVRGVGGGAGSVASSTGLPSDPPAIVFRPNQPPLAKQ